MAIDKIIEFCKHLNKTNYLDSLWCFDNNEYFNTIDLYRLNSKTYELYEIAMRITKTYLEDEIVTQEKFLKDVNFFWDTKTQE